MEVSNPQLGGPTAENSNVLHSLAAFFSMFERFMFTKFYQRKNLTLDEGYGFLTCSSIWKKIRLFFPYDWSLETK
jgi:hypothetical protein